MHGLLEFHFLTRAGFGSIRFFCAVGRCKGPYRDSYEYTRLLQHCEGTKKLKEIHAQITTSGYEHNPFLATKLVSQYAEHSGASMKDARRVFDSVYERDVLLWNVVIQGYTNSGPFEEALNVYDQMRWCGIYANQYTFPFVLKACAVMGDGKKGQIIHGHVVKVGLETDLFVGNALVALYAKWKKIEISRKVFDEIPQKDLVSWNSMIAGYAQNECADEALMLLHWMLRDNTIPLPDHATLVGVLPACAQATAIQEGMWIHLYVIKSGMKIDVALGSGLIAMYANCGRLGTARNLFDRMPERNVLVWNTMIRCYGMHGHVDEALGMFSQMVDIGIHPDGMSFVCVLSACSHTGLVNRGLELFEKMENYGVEKSDKHYACMVDLLGRAGCLDKAVQFIRKMPVKAGKDVLGALLGACRIHNNIELAEEVAERLFAMDPENAGRYILLAKMYEDAGLWEEAARVRKVLREKKIRKQHGCSTIEVDYVHHTFGVEDESHPMTRQIFNTLEKLERVMEEDMVRA